MTGCARVGVRAVMHAVESRLHKTSYLQCMGEIRVMEKVFFTQMELKPGGNTAVMSEIAQVHASTAADTVEKKNNRAGLWNNDTISRYIF